MPNDPEEHPDGPGGWWPASNPWHARAIYLPVEDLSLALGHESVPSHWMDYGTRLDAYLLPQPSGSILAGVRYGPGGADYLSPWCEDSTVQEALREIAASVGDAPGRISPARTLAIPDQQNGENNGGPSCP